MSPPSRSSRAAVCSRTTTSHDREVLTGSVFQTWTCTAASRRSSPDEVVGGTRAARYSPRAKIFSSRDRRNAGLSANASVAFTGPRVSRRHRGLPHESSRDECSSRGIAFASNSQPVIDGRANPTSHGQTSIAPSTRTPITSGVCRPHLAIRGGKTQVDFHPARRLRASIMLMRSPIAWPRSSLSLCSEPGRVARILGALRLGRTPDTTKSLIGEK